MGRSSEENKQRVMSQPPSERPHEHHNKPRVLHLVCTKNLVKQSKVSAMEDKEISKWVEVTRKVKRVPNEK